MSDIENVSNNPPELDPATRKRARNAAVKYGLARFVLFIILTAIIQVASVAIGAPIPLVMSALLALILALPLSMLVFTKLRVEATESVAMWSDQRNARKEWVRRELENR